MLLPSKSIQAIFTAVEHFLGMFEETIKMLPLNWAVEKTCVYGMFSVLYFGYQRRMTRVLTFNLWVEARANPPFFS